MIAVVDYGLGNVQAFLNIYHRLDIPAKAAQCAADLEDADRLILPGVGAFDWAMTRLEESGMRERLDHLVRDQGRPVLGICVGMQMMAESSEEGRLPGLGWIAGRVKRFEPERIGPTTPLPHMGWNDVASRDGASLFRGLGQNPRFYFLHSYYFVPRDDAAAAALTDYSGCFASAVHAGNKWGVQFHPEKSHEWGVTLLKNFAE